MNYIIEPQKNVPICEDVDLFVAGGSCTGVFAAVRAARLGLKVVLVERQNCLGGMATAALVNVWHSFKDVDYKNQVIAGLTADDMGFGALRVMVNLNQLGKAAGTAAYIALNQTQAVKNIDGRKVRELLIKGGSAL